MLRLFSFTMFAFLKLTIVLTQNIHSLILNVCYTIENLLQVNCACIESVPNSSDIKKQARTETLDGASVERVTISTQTDLANILPYCMQRKNSDPDILVYNLSSTRLITVAHDPSNRNCTQKFHCCHCERLDPEVKQSNAPDPQIRNSTFKNGNTFNITNSNLYQHVNSICSDISIEKDVVNSQIILNSPVVIPDSMILKEKLVDNSTQKSSYNCQNTDTVVSKFEVQENDENSPPSQTSVDYTKEEVDQHKTSSPISYGSKLPAADRREIEIAFHSEQNAMESDGVLTKNFENLNEFYSSDQFNKSSVLENTILLDDIVKQRLSLSPNTKNNTAKTALSLKSLRDEMLEHTRKTPRNETNTKEIKFPYTPEISGLFQTVDEEEESKEMFSCSSYESLPVSDHIRTVFEKNVPSLYRENFSIITEPDFSSVDSFVEAFRKLESTISISESAMNRISERCFQSKNSKNTFARNLSVEFLEIDKRQNRHNMRKAVSSGMLYNTSSYEHSPEEKSLARELAESEYQHCNPNLAPVNSVFNSRTSSLSSIANDENSGTEVKESDRENSKYEEEYKEDKNIVNNNSAKTNLGTDLVYLNNHKRTCENSSKTVESNGSHSDSVQFVRTQNIPEHNQENEALIGKSTQNVDFKSQTKPTVIENFELISNKQKCSGKKNRYARKTFTGVHRKSNAGISSVTTNRNINKSLSNENCKSELLKTCSKSPNSDLAVSAVQKLQKEEEIENKESLKVEENLINVEKNTNSLNLDDTQSMQSVINNDITFIEDEFLRTPENKGVDKILNS